jgi:hypothetical protein
MDNILRVERQSVLQKKSHGSKSHSRREHGFDLSISPNVHAAIHSRGKMRFLTDHIRFRSTDMRALVV